VIPCPEKDCKGKIEASTRVFLDVVAGTFDKGELTIEDMQFSHNNDHLDGIPCNLESEFHIACDHCGYEPMWYMSADPKMADRIGVQPIGNAPRTTGVRGGLCTLPDPPAHLADAWARYQGGGGADVTPSELRALDEWRGEVAEAMGL
jgi:hypothetical protein